MVLNCHSPYLLVSFYAGPIATQLTPVDVVPLLRVRMTPTFNLGSGANSPFRTMPTDTVSGVKVMGVANTVGVPLKGIGKVTIAPVGVLTAVGEIVTVPHWMSNPSNVAY